MNNSLQAARLTSKRRFYWPLFLTVLIALSTLSACSSAGEADLQNPTLTPRTVLEESTEAATENPPEENAPTPGIAGATQTATSLSTTLPLTYQIVQEKSEARFYIDEVLFGSPKTVIGRTSDISGEILVDLAQPAQAKLSQIVVNARSLTTDESFRNRALRRQILESAQDQYQFIVFEPLEYKGLPLETMFGEPISFTITGFLTIRDLTHPVTFEMTVTPISEDELRGAGSATVSRADFDLVIPNVTGVAEVSEDVRLEVDFTAIPASES